MVSVLERYRFSCYSAIILSISMRFCSATMRPRLPSAHEPHYVLAGDPKSDPLEPVEDLGRFNELQKDLRLFQGVSLILQ